MSALVVRFRSQFRSSFSANIAAVVAELLERGTVWSNSAIREACVDSFVGGGRYWTTKPSYGAVEHVLGVLRRSALIEWGLNYVRRWHAGKWCPLAGAGRVRNGKLPTRALRATSIQPPPTTQPPPGPIHGTQGGEAVAPSTVRPIEAAWLPDSLKKRLEKGEGVDDALADHDWECIQRAKSGG
jgi:hypothetical protein